MLTEFLLFLSVCRNSTTQKVLGPSLPNLRRELIGSNCQADYIYRLPYPKLTEPWMKKKTNDRAMKTHHTVAACKGFWVLLLLHSTPPFNHCKSNESWNCKLCGLKHLLVPLTIQSKPPCAVTLSFWAVVCYVAVREFGGPQVSL